MKQGAHFLLLAALLGGVGLLFGSLGGSFVSTSPTFEPYLRRYVSIQPATMPVTLLLYFKSSLLLWGGACLCSAGILWWPYKKEDYDA